MMICSDSGFSRADGWRFPSKVRKFLMARYGEDCIHLFGGKSTFGIRLDIDESLRPHVIGDAWCPPFKRDSARAVILDPPYVYMNVHMKSALFQRAAWIAREEVVWFHTLWVDPVVRELRPSQSYLVRVGRNCAVRALQIFAVTGEKRPPAKYIKRGPGMKFNRWVFGQDALQFPRPAPVEASTTEAK